MTNFRLVVTILKEVPFRNCAMEFKFWEEIHMMKKPCGISYRERFVAILSVLLFSGVLLCGCGSVEGSVGEVAVEILVVGLGSDHSAVVAAEGERGTTELNLALGAKLGYRGTQMRVRRNAAGKN